MVDVAETGNLMSNMAMLKVRNDMVRFWPKKVVTDAVTDVTDEVFDRLYLLISDTYVSEANMDKVGDTIRPTLGYTDGIDHKVGDIVVYADYNSEVSRKYYSSEYVGQRYEILEIVAEREELVYWTGAGQNQVKHTVTNCTQVKFGIPGTPWKFSGGDEFLDNQLLRTQEQIKQRLIIHKEMGLTDLVEVAYKGNKWKKLDAAWVEYRNDYAGGRPTNISYYYNAYADGLTRQENFRVTRDVRVIVPSHKDLREQSIRDEYTDELEAKADADGYGGLVLGSNILLMAANGETKVMTPNDEFSIYMLLKSGEIRTENDPLGDNGYAVLTNEVKGPVGYKVDWVGDDYGYGSNIQYVTMTITTDFRYLKLLPREHPVWEQLTNELDKIDKYYNDLEQGSIVATIDDESIYLEGFANGLAERLKTVPDDGLWLSESYEENTYWDGEKFSMFTNVNNRVLRVENFGKAKVDKLRSIYMFMEFNYNEDKKKHARLVQTLTAIFSMVLIIVAVVMTVISFGALSGASAAMISAVIAISATATLIGVQKALTKAGYDKSGLIVGVWMKVYGQVSMVVGLGAALNAGIQQLAITVAVKQAVKEAAKFVMKKFGGNTAVAINIVINAVSGFAGGGFQMDSTSIASGIMGAINSGMATKTQLAVMDIEAQRNMFTDSEQKILEEVEKKEMELAMVENQAGFIALDQAQWNSMRDYDPVDRNTTDDTFGSFFNQIDNLTTKNFS